MSKRYRSLLVIEQVLVLQEDAFNPLYSFLTTVEDNRGLN